LQVGLLRKLVRLSFPALVKRLERSLWAKLSGTVLAGTKGKLTEVPVKSLRNGNRPPKSLALRLTGLCLGLAGLIAVNALPAYKAQVEMAFLTILICWFFVYDFWDLRNEAGFRSGVFASAALHAVVLIAVWKLLPMHLLLVLGIACVERFAVMLICFKSMEREN
jgi:hypothetical protein